MTKFTEAQIKNITNEIKGLTIQDLEYEKDGDYFVMTFTDESEISFRFMSDLV